MTNVLIVDDERNIHKAYKADIDASNGKYILIDAITNAADTELICMAKKIDLILMDINTADQESGIQATKRIKSIHPEIKVIITTSYMDPYAMNLAKDAGADSFWYKDICPIELLEVMDLTMDGTCYWPSKIQDVSIGDANLSDFTNAEIEVMHHLAKYISIKKIADAMCIEETTVKYHLKNICRKIGCENKTELLVLLMQGKLILPNM